MEQTTRSIDHSISKRQASLEASSGRCGAPEGLSPAATAGNQPPTPCAPAQIVRGEKTLAPLRPRKRSDGTSSPNARANDMGQILTSQPHELLIWGPLQIGGPVQPNRLHAHVDGPGSHARGTRTSVGPWEITGHPGPSMTCR